MAVIAWWGAVVAFAGSVLLLLLSIAGAVHLRRTPAEAKIHVGHTASRAATA